MLYRKKESDGRGIILPCARIEDIRHFFRLINQTRLRQCCHSHEDVVIGDSARILNPAPVPDGIPPRRVVGRRVM